MLDVVHKDELIKMMPTHRREIDYELLKKSLMVEASKLTLDERACRLINLCNSLGLNPATNPFEYISLNGKLILYARKDATDQLRRLYGVSIQKIDSIDINGICIVTAYATLPDGRTDSDIGAVNITNLKGDMLANAFMKAHTKAKRRVTLSICGLGMLDESELETISNIQPIIEEIKPKKLEINHEIQDTVTSDEREKILLHYQTLIYECDTMDDLKETFIGITKEISDRYKDKKMSEIVVNWKNEKKELLMKNLSTERGI